MDLKKTLVNTFQSLTGKVVDIKNHQSLQYWEQAITNNAATIDTFITHIITQDDYVDFALDIFSTAFNDIIHEHTYVIKDFFDEFWKVHRGKKVSPQLCREYICSMAFFDAYITDMINDIINFEFGRVGSTQEIQFYAEKVTNTAGHLENYTIHDLMKDIPKNIFLDEDSQKDVDGPFTQQHYKKNASSTFDEESVDNFEDVFNRPMFIQEYFKYIVEKNTNDQSIEDLLKTHTFKYNKLRSIFQSYTGKSISEYYFVKKYLYKVDDPSFYDNNIDDIVNSIEYKQGMQKVLFDKYQKMYDVSLYDSDIDYIFDIVKTKKLDILTEELDFILQILKEQTDEIVSNIFKVFGDVLLRAPDMSEIEKYISFFRERKDSHTPASSNGELERILVRTLEFHDIIKKHIRTIYSENKDKEILHSSMYDILNRIISRIDEVNMRTLDDIVHSLI